MISCNMLALAVIFAQLQRISLRTITTVAYAVMAIISYPIVGIVADTCVRRFKFIQAGIAFLMVSSLLSLVLILLQDYLPATAQTICMLCTTGLCCIGASCYMANAFPFVADQLIGASGEQLSFAVYWIMWGIISAYNTGPVLLESIPCDYLDILVEAASFLCTSVMALAFTYFKNLFTIFPHLVNPYKLIFKVLNYARKDKYPERRSALTYWEEDIPSRIDLGMSKYGGPFTVEEGEDVKTLFRLLPGLVCGGGCHEGTLMYWYKILEGESLFDSYLSLLIIFSLGIPIYHFSYILFFTTTFLQCLIELELGWCYSFVHTVWKQL